MKSKQFAILCSVVVITGLSSCKKKTSTPTEDTTPVVVTPVNKICTGNGTTSYFPLDSLNTWGFSYTISGMAQSSSPLYKVVGTILYNAKKYSNIDDIGSFNQSMYLREDIVSHDIYEYNSSNGQEYLYIPVNPVLNQTWPIQYGSRKITNLSATKTTSSCTYTGLLEISDLDVNGVAYKLNYFKKGIGMVNTTETGSFPGVYNLKSVTLK